MKIPAFLLSVSVSISISIFIFSSGVYAETIDITPTPEYGDDINISTSVGNRSEIEGTKLGPRPNQVKFPNLSQEEAFYSNTEGMFGALPDKLTQSLKFDDPTNEKIEADFKGKLAHPTCGRAKIIKRYIPSEGADEVIETQDVSLSSSPVNFTPTQDFFQTLLRTRFWQSIFVPQKGSDLNFALAKPGQPDIPSELANCHPDIAGRPLEAITIANEAPKLFDLSGVLGILDGFLKFLRGIFDQGGGGSMALEAKLEQAKYLPGETVFADQTVGNNGFLNFIKPGAAAFSNQGDEEEQVQYVVLKDNNTREVGVTYKGVSSLKGGTLDLVKSLYPEGMAPTSLEAAVPVSAPIGSIPPGPLAQTLPSPKSQKLTDLIKQAATSFGVPIPVLAAVAWVEGRAMWSLTDSEVEQYSAPGAQSPLNPEPNGCTAAGPMQFIIGGYARDCEKLYTGKILDSVWIGYANAVNEATGENRTTDYRNIKDSIYAAAKKLQEGSGMPKNDFNWNEQAVRSSIRSWYGSCLSDDTTDSRFGKGKSFCDFVWEAVVQSRQPF